MLFPETERKDRKKGKQKFVKCSSSRLSYCKQALLKYIHKYSTNPQVSLANIFMYKEYFSMVAALLIYLTFDSVDSSCSSHKFHSVQRLFE